MRSLFTTTVDGNVVRWYEDEPRKRSILVRAEGAGNIVLKRLEWPHVVYAVLTRDDRFTSLHTFTARAPVQNEDSDLVFLAHCNYVRGDVGQVCFGSALNAVTSGADPIETFWNSSFHDLNQRALRVTPQAAPFFKPRDFASRYSRAQHGGLTYEVNTGTIINTGGGWATTTTTGVAAGNTVGWWGGAGGGGTVTFTPQYVTGTGQTVEVAYGQSVTIRGGNGCMITMQGPVTITWG